MATENIVSKKYRILSDVTNKVWDVISFFTKASDVELTNGKNLETTCGSITGISSSLTSTSTTVAASASAIKQLNDKITELNSNLGDVYYLGTGTSFNVSNIPGYQNLTANNFIIEGVAGSATGNCEYGNRKALDHAYSSNTSMSVSVGSYAKSYNASTGMLTISKPTLYASVSGTTSFHSVSGSANTVLGDPKVYLVKGKIKNA